MVDGRAPDELLLGAWARSGGFVGLVVAMDAEKVTLFDPGERQVMNAAPAEIEPVPAGGVTVTVSVDLPVPHGVSEATLRRWIAALADDTLRARAQQALSEQGLDDGATLPAARFFVVPVTNGTVCLCGSRIPAPPGTEMVCTNCGRLAVGPPTAH
jgi:hypothetical protein